MRFRGIFIDLALGGATNTHLHAQAHTHTEGGDRGEIPGKHRIIINNKDTFHLFISFTDFVSAAAPRSRSRSSSHSSKGVLLGGRERGRLWVLNTSPTGGKGEGWFKCE